ncbi:MAG: hypothetical protein JWO51_215 [Rhodospirillales bacterium]|nr:hypothetical protein [Rhodospirillales bacterium]
MIWVEILSRQRDVLTRHHIAGDSLTIGRGYGNDVMVDDPHVAANHLRIGRNAEGALVAEDQGSVNGLYLEGVAKRLGRVVINGDRLIRIGQTLLRIRDDAYLVPAERPLISRRPRWPLLVLLTLAILAIELVGAWRGDFREFKPATYIQPVLAVIGIVGIWVTVWTLLSRIIVRAARFETHLLIGLVAMLTVSVANEFADFGAFALSWPGLVEARFAIGFVVMGAAALAHMRAIGPGRLRLKLAGAAALPALMIGYHAVIDADQQRTLDPPSYVHLLFPPAFRASPLNTEDGLLKDLGEMRLRIDQARLKDKS